jgi:hypothetical protein
MNVLPDDLWWSEQSRMRAMSVPSASDVDEGIALFPYTTEESVLLVGLGVLSIVFSCAVMASLAVTGTWSTILIRRKLKGSTFLRGRTKGVSLS